MAHRHRQRAVGAGLGRQPVVCELDVVGVVGRDDHDLLAAVARLGHEMRVGRARDRQVGAPHDQVARVPPVGRLRHVGLVAEHLRRSRRQVRVPVVERRRVPPISDRKRVPAANDTGDIAGIGVKPPTRSGPCSRIACTVAAAISSVASSQSQRTNPPRPRSPGSGRRRPPAANAATGSAADARAARQPRAGCPDVRVLQPGRRVRVPGERRARGQPRGSWSGRSGSVRG